MLLIFTNVLLLMLLIRKDEQWAELKNQQAWRDLEEGRPGVFYV